MHGQGEKRIRIHYDGHTAVLSTTKGKNSWLLTGWKNKGRIKQREAGTHVHGEGNDSTAPTASAPTLTRRERGGAPASSSSVSLTRMNVNVSHACAGMIPPRLSVHPHCRCRLAPVYRNELKGKKPVDRLEDPPTEIDLSNIAFDDIHINQWRKHGVDYETAKKLMAECIKMIR